jgi:hypothetical protein
MVISWGYMPVVIQHVFGLLEKKSRKRRRSARELGWRKRSRTTHPSRTLEAGWRLSEDDATITSAIIMVKKKTKNQLEIQKYLLK